MKYLFSILIILSALNIATAQDCESINVNGTFESLNFAPGLEPAVGITSGLMQSWNASHGTADFVTADWNWYGLPGFNSNMGHICYGNRDTHDHSEGIYTAAPIYGDDDLIYTLKFDFASICDSDKNGFINIALNNNLNSEDHGFFQFPTEETYPAFFSSNQNIARLELTPETALGNGISSYETSFTATDHFGQLWFYTEYLHEFEDFVNCGFVLDNVNITATTTALSDFEVKVSDDGMISIDPVFSRNMNLTNVEWIVDGVSVGFEKQLMAELEDGLHTICLEFTDSRGACGSLCQEIEIGATPEEETEEEEEEEERDIDEENNGISFGTDANDSDDNEEEDDAEELDEEETAIVVTDHNTNEEDEEETEEVNVNDDVNLDFAFEQNIQTPLDVQVYPNPAYQKLNVKMNTSEQTTAIVFASNGEKVSTIENLENKDSIDLISLAPGMYALHLVSGDQRVVKKFFKAQN